MIVPKKMQLAIGLALAFTYASAIGSEPNLPAIELFFGKRGPWIVKFDKRGPIIPSYRVGFTVQWRFEQTNEPNASDLLKTSAGKTVSTLQKELLKTERAFWLDFKVNKTVMSKHDVPMTRHGVPFGSATYGVMAVSEEDARKMAYALVEFLIEDEKASTRRMKKNHIEKLSVMQDELRKKIEKAYKEIKTKNNGVPATYQKFLDAVENSPYSLHPSDGVPGEVRKTIFEMDKMLDILNIEIVGIQSKLSAIKKYSSQSDVRNSETLSTTLKEMAIRQEIDLVGAESRRQAIMGVKRREEALYSKYEAYLDLKSEIATLKDSVNQDSEEIRRLDKDIYFLGRGERTFIMKRNVAGHPSAVIVDIQPVMVKE
ncbi:MAG TPA: hypothetical protein DIU00_15545 [Phycisphaerales bacterium]|nr:hypothetical protein [Phycisphaerales bacterium]